VKLEDLWLDIGAKNKDEAKELVRIGDAVTLKLGYQEMRNGLANSPAMDNKCGLWVVIEALRRASARSLNCALFAVSTVQEEIGLRGATTSTFGVQPQVGIAVDVTHATLREMIDSRQRVVVLTESGRPGVDWFHPAFAVMQETPYSFKQPSELSCAPNRGGTSGALFLMNNWIDTTPAPKPSNAAIVNAYDALLARARRCQAERGKLPTVLAVDFYRTGAVLRVARTLNGLAVAATD
jgi:hypothetical protein